MHIVDVTVAGVTAKRVRLIGADPFGNQATVHVSDVTDNRLHRCIRKSDDLKEGIRVPSPFHIKGWSSSFDIDSRNPFHPSRLPDSTLGGVNIPPRFNFCFPTLR